MQPAGQANQATYHWPAQQTAHHRANGTGIGDGVFNV